MSWASSFEAVGRNVLVPGLLVGDHGSSESQLTCRLGWDGKPIPYWLYKLHGLGVTFSCEICAGASYQGRKGEFHSDLCPVLDIQLTITAFDRHFTEARHA